MNARRTFAITRKVLRSLRHDRRTVGFLVLMPVFMIAIFGYTFGGDVEDVDVYVVNMDPGVGGTSLSEMMIAHLLEDDTLNVVDVITSEDMTDPVAYGRERVRNGDAWACVIFPENLTSSIVTYVATLGGETSSIEVLLDGSNTNIAQAIMSSVQAAMSDTLTEDIGFVPPLQVQGEMEYGAGMSFIDTFAPGVISLAVMMVTFMLSIISFIHERTTGTLARLLATPVTEGEIVLGYAMAFGLIGLVQSIVVLSTALILFDVQVEGSLLLVLMIIFLLGVGMQGLGFLLSANARNEFQAIQFIPLILFPSILLSGVFWPMEAVPAVLRPVSYLLPLTYAIDGARSTMVRGWGLEEVWLDVVILATFAVAMMVLSVMIMRKR